MPVFNLDSCLYLLFISFFYARHRSQKSSHICDEIKASETKQQLFNSDDYSTRNMVIF